jgi:hypothetical protein
MRPRLPLLLLGAVLALAGCRSTPPAQGPDPLDQTTPDTTADTVDPPPAGAAPTCALVPAAVIKASLNLAVSEPTQTTSGSTVTCDYRPNGGALAVIVKFSTGEDKDSFARVRRSLDNRGVPTSDVPGLFDEAYVSSSESGDTVTNSLVARKGSITMSVDAVASIEAEKSLVVKVLGGAD